MGLGWRWYRIEPVLEVTRAVFCAEVECLHSSIVTKQDDKSVKNSRVIVAESKVKFNNNTYYFYLLGNAVSSPCNSFSLK